MSVAILVGTRPEIIKMSPVVAAFGRRGIDFFLLHTGQHYSYEMDRVFFERLALPEPRHHLAAGSGSHADQTARMIQGIAQVLERESSTLTLVLGDTNTVLAGALAASKLRIPVGHIEAGLRSFDRTMPEEINRIVADHISDWLYAPTATSAAQLRAEGIPPDRVRVTGNTIVDAVAANRAGAAAKSRILKTLRVESGAYVLLTAHRQENVDDARRLRGILEGARRAAAALGIPAVFPIHPRTRKRIQEFGLDPAPIQLTDPLDYFDFLHLEANARLILTDSGGVQEEACILGVPCVTVRDNTERPETLEAGANRLAGANPERIEEAARRMTAAPRNWKNPFGDGHAADRIAEHVEAVL